MKLQQLKIDSKFRSLVKETDEGNLIPFELHFRPEFEPSHSEEDWLEFHPFCFAGLNGSGKSNVLEALANIFYHLEICVNVNLPTNFEKNYEESYPNVYELEYFVVPKVGEQYVDAEDYTIENLWKVCIQKEYNQPPKVTARAFPFDENSKIDTPSIRPSSSAKQPASAKKYLPNLVVGYSSGENEILSIPFLKTRLLQYDEYIQALEKEERYDEPESSMIYIDYAMSQSVLLSNLIFYHQESERDVLKPIREELGILDIARFRMNLRNHQLSTDYSTSSSKAILEQIKRANNQQDDEEKIIDKFKNCATSYFEKDEHLVLDFWVNEATKKAFELNFGNIFELFRAFQLLYILNYRSLDESLKTEVYRSSGFYTDEKIFESSPTEQTFHFLDFFVEKRDFRGEVKELSLKQLSDGEQQFLHSLGICLMLRGRNALLLLDEPETHFNPDWRSKFIRTLKSSLEASNSNNLMRDILITSHSPFIISDCKKHKVFVFRDGHVLNPEINTYGTSVGILLEEIFGKEETISEMALDDIERLKEFPMDTLEEIERIKEASRTLGESLEKVLLFRQLLLKEKQIKDQNA